LGNRTLTFMSDFVHGMGIRVEVRFPTLLRLQGSILHT
jgi:hypothetical protein